MRRGKNQKLIIKIMTAHTFSKWRVKVLKARTVSINHFCQIPWQFSSFKRRVKILTTRTFSKNHVSLKHSDEGGREGMKHVTLKFYSFVVNVCEKPSPSTLSHLWNTISLALSRSHLSTRLFFLYLSVLPLYAILCGRVSLSTQVLNPIS